MSDTSIVDRRPMSLAGDFQPDAASCAVDYHPGSVIAELFREPGRFDFFQAVSLLEELDLRRAGVGRTARPGEEAVRFRAALGEAFPQSAICEVLPPTPSMPQPEMTVALFGLTGPSGILPRHYTQQLYRIARDARGTEKNALGDWLDLFNHRLLSLFYRGWQKYRFTTAPARGESAAGEFDTFTTAIFSFAGLGLPELRNRLEVTAVAGAALSRQSQTLAKVNDLTLLRYSGLLSQRPRTAGNLQQLLHDYFNLPVRIEQFRGQWLVLDPPQQSRLGEGDANNMLGGTAIAGTRVWDVSSKFRVRLGPLNYEQFIELLPDRAATPRRKSFFLLCHLVRLFVGPELDYDVQLVLRAGDVPACQLSSDDQHGLRLGWNTWLGSQPPQSDAGDAHFEGVHM